LDIDHFKAINDTYGHAAGDQVLQIVGRAIRRVVRAPDIAGRLGGEEFGIVLPETDRREGLVFAERLRADLAALQVSYEGATIRFTCSVGIATRGAADGLDTMLKEADAAMYRAKREGRNRVSVAPAAGAG
jgi:diguanylate cyclase (GGDEF)-like protein